jgi:hypothetical protein
MPTEGLPFRPTIERIGPPDLGRGHEPSLPHPRAVVHDDAKAGKKRRYL